MRKRTLSLREKQVLELIISGHTYKEVACQLDIGVETIRTYLKRVRAKMAVETRTEAVAKYCSVCGGPASPSTSAKGWRELASTVLT